MAKKKDSSAPSGVVWDDEAGHYVFLGDGSEYPEPKCAECGEPLVGDPVFRVLDVLARAEGVLIYCPRCTDNHKIHGRYLVPRKDAGAPAGVEP